MSANEGKLNCPPDIVVQINVMYQAAVDDSKRREMRFGYPLARSREHLEYVRAYLVQLVEESSE